MGHPGQPPDVRLANEIAIQFAHVPTEKAVAEIAKHMHSFWEPRMVRALLAHIDAGGGDLDPLAVAAAEQLRQPA
ncbi:MAG: formate dehydrogenase subunit delta [Actinophytocola sp.]|uniref:formate dehydrogenase subunit delta n=1 Tax=Actinophytocola sp. TaxID=1872138 RepID=UPI0013227E29|nr:formate dehydrogenase subunit delta [Actinophytocola sp.]MPZ81330.1 formate dehydrogenase subunit delta [Actinophytocola sp.]